MRIENMRRILMIVDEGGISNAAKKLFISQPTLSQMVKNTEEKLGVSIFEHQAKGLQLTFAGEQFVIMARKMVTSWDHMLGDLQEIKNGERDKIKVCLTLRRGVSYLPVVLPSLLNRHPAASVEQIIVPVEEQEAALLHRKADIVISGDPIINADIKTIPLQPEYYMLIASKDSDFARKFSMYQYTNDVQGQKQLSIRETDHERFILPSSRFRSRQIFNRIAQESNITPLSLMEVADIDMAVGMVRAGLGISLLPMVLMNDGHLCNYNDQLCYFLLDSPYTMRPAYMCYDKSTYLSAIHMEFIQLMYAYFGTDGEHPHPLP